MRSKFWFLLVMAHNQLIFSNQELSVLDQKILGLFMKLDLCCGNLLSFPIPKWYESRYG